jgi:hypothetical protein
MNMLNRELFKGLNISEKFQPSTWFTSFTPKPCEHACAHASESNRERERERESVETNNIWLLKLTHLVSIY